MVRWRLILSEPPFASRARGVFKHVFLADACGEAVTATGIFTQPRVHHGLHSSKASLQGLRLKLLAVPRQKNPQAQEHVPRRNGLGNTRVVPASFRHLDRGDGSYRPQIQKQVKCLENDSNLTFRVT